MNGRDRATLVAIATTHPQLSVRRSAAHALYSLGCITGAVTTAESNARERAAELAAGKVTADAIAKAKGGAA
jgi:hypothetical protein